MTPADADDVQLHLHWQPRRWLLALTLIALVPPMTLWTTAVADSTGITHVLTSLPVPATVSGRTERLLLLDTFLTVMLVFPLLAVLASFLATVAFDVRIASWEITARLRLPAPPWTLAQLATTALFVVGAILFVAMAGHLVADCVFGIDCVPS